MPDIGNFVFVTVLLTTLVPIVITIVVVGMVVWAIRRAMPGGKNAAEMELRARLARGEISPSEFEATLDALRRSS